MIILNQKIELALPDQEDLGNGIDLGKCRAAHVEITISEEGIDIALPETNGKGVTLEFEGGNLICAVHKHAGKKANYKFLLWRAPTK